MAVTADIEPMFYCFVVQEDHRDFLRFLWYEDNNLKKDIVDYRMRVHIFGNRPAVAIFRLRMAVWEAEGEYGTDARRFIGRDFYVDDALKFFPTEAEAINVLWRARDILALSNLRVYKIASNSAKVVNAFPPEERAEGVKDLDLSIDKLPVQRSLGVTWDTMSDTFTFHIPQTQKPFTCRGVLSMINSLFDPLCFLAPVIIEGRWLLRELSSSNLEWDSLLPQDMYEGWRKWQDSLQDLGTLHICHTYVSFSLSLSLY